MPQFTPEQARLYQSCIPLAKWLARKVARRSPVPLDDLECDALTALADAAMMFRADYGSRFAAYAGQAIRYRLRESVAKYRGKLPTCQFPLDPDGEPLDFPSRRREQMGAIEVGELVGKLKRRLPERDFAILWRVCAAGETLGAVGQSMGVCGERVRQMVVKVSEKARGVVNA